MKRKALGLLVLLMLVSAAAGYGVWWWVMQRAVPMQAERIDYIIEAGSGPKAIARQMREAGISLDENQFVWLARLTEKDKQLQAGAYEAVRGDTLWALLERMAQGDMLQTRVTLIEGWDYKRIRTVLSENSHVKQTLTELSDAELLAQLGANATHPEGLFYPDTYVFVPGTTDYDILRRAYQAQTDLLEKMWAERAPDLPLKTPYEALILASIVEKETGHSADRERVAGVFINRLRRGMLLQTDPTVIYGMGDAYEGRIRKRDLQTDTPWNTYTRTGLPPTPIATPSKAALQATLHPEQHHFLYFVSRGDGTSEFSRNLTEHNRAVRKYILNKS
ncbi:endolytic transglycosylase MltG [Paenalcaligenes hominis]|uniref:Endolytic murein transglycosylase n=1 Tax=Paenalcaligenes hominis TaxID=643674 RepID=A0ABX0WQD1_9BURK|nr:endolytic transglycosylase MltG [Paenalcaligenes hominis]NJB64484.1 UPF0755 protein [Paenalcaligenes hominis]GGE67293.1 hypothetical protein GCM10007278_14180 [Paenalcaligenes hominis]